MESSKSILTKIFAEYYLTGAQAKKEGRPVAFITAFAPVEILRAMGVFCMYPESYAVVCAASKKAPEMIAASQMAGFAHDLCSYSLIDFGTQHHPRLPYGGLPEPDFLVATNNQCGTTLLWFKLLAQQKNIPLFIIDYPAPVGDDDSLKGYVHAQYESLIQWIQYHTKHPIDSDSFAEQVACSRETCRNWQSVHQLNQQRPIRISADKLVNALFPIVTLKGTQSACDYYKALLREHQTAPAEMTAETVDTKRLLWHGYPIWYLAKKFPSLPDDMQIVLNDYTLWWDLDYGPEHTNPMQALVSAYSNTYLNWPLAHKLDWIEELVREYSIDGVICHANRSCRRAMTDIIPLRKRLSDRNTSSVTIESDMANPEFYLKEQVKLRLESFCDILKTA